MSTLYPGSLQDLDATRGTDNQKLSTPNHATHHQNEDDTIEALQAKVGADGSAVTTSHDYKLSGVTGSDKAVSKTGTETLTNKTLTAPVVTSPTVNVGSDADQDIYKRDASGNFVRLAKGTANQVLAMDGTGTSLGYTSDITALLPALSLTTAGIAELATTAEIDTGTDSTRAIPVDQFVASKRNIRYLAFRIVESSTAVTASTDIYGDFVCPFSGTILQDDTNVEWLSAALDTAGTTGTMTVDINLNGTTIMTTNKISIETTEKSSTTAATQPDLTTTAISAGDILTFDVDAIHTTPGTGLTIYMAIRE